VEDIVIISLAIGIPLAVGAIRPTRGALGVLLAIALGFVTVMLGRDFLDVQPGHDRWPPEMGDLAWAAIVYALTSALVVGGWLAGRTVRRRTHIASAGSA